jgi:hypothetical protein
MNETAIKYSVSGLYQSACFDAEPKKYLERFRGNINDGKKKADVDFLLSNSILTKDCKHCGEEIKAEDFDYSAGYWTPNLWRPYHKSCKKEAASKEAVSCQTLDANCNDCKCFKREKIESELTKAHSFLAVKFWVERKEERRWMVGDAEVVKDLALTRLAKIGDRVGFNGFCEKKNIAVHAQSNTSTNYECFQHRKS